MKIILKWNGPDASPPPLDTPVLINFLLEKSVYHTRAVSKGPTSLHATQSAKPSTYVEFYILEAINELVNTKHSKCSYFNLFVYLTTVYISCVSL